MQWISILVLVIAPAWGQSSSAPRLPNRHPDMQGVWQSAVISAAFDVQAHEADDQIPAGPSQALVRLELLTPSRPTKERMSAESKNGSRPRFFHFSQRTW